MTKCSLDLIENASLMQINAAYQYNQVKISKLLLKLLAIDFISNNKDELINQQSHINDKITNKQEKLQTISTKKLNKFIKFLFILFSI